MYCPSAQGPLKHMLGLAQTHAPDDVYARAAKHFTEKEIVDQTLVVGAINLWNRLTIATRALPGFYKPAKSASTSS